MIVMSCADKPMSRPGSVHGWALLALGMLAALITGCAQPLPSVAVEPVEEEPSGDTPAPPAAFAAEDMPNDAGRVLLLTWTRSPDDRVDLDLKEDEEPPVTGYRLYRATVAEDGTVGEFRQIGDVDDMPPQSVQYRDDSNVRPNQPYQYRLVAVGPGGMESESMELTEPVIAVRHWFDSNKFWFAWLTALCCGFIVLFIYLAKQGVDLRIRKIAGLEAVDEAVGRATEMGKPILFVPGIADMNEIQTVAGLTILSRVGRLCAEYDAKIEVPTRRSLVMTTARETLQTAYMAGGRPDAYHEDMSYYVSDEQFAYVAHLTVYITREKPAAVFYLGAFFAESLILAETGNSEGAIQVAGTAQPAQLPFFVAACDYTLIGEEFFAASAYLSGEPEQLGTLKGQDMGKILGGLLVIIGCIMATAAEIVDSDDLRSATNYLRFQILGTEDVPEEVIKVDEDGNPPSVETSNRQNASLPALENPSPAALEALASQRLGVSWEVEA